MHRPVAVLIFALCLSGCTLDRAERLAVSKIPQRSFDRSLWRAAAQDDPYAGRVRFSMYRDVMRRTRIGTSLVDVLGEYGAPGVYLSSTSIGASAFGKAERPRGAVRAVSYLLVADRGGSFSLNLTFCFDVSDRLLQVVENW